MVFFRTWFVASVVAVVAKADTVVKVKDSNPDEADILFQDFFDWKLFNAPQEAATIGFGKYANEVKAFQKTND
jgi:hypothetical protein